MGNYKVAHQQLQQFCRILRSKAKHVPPNLLKQLMLLHSYILVKLWIGLGDHRCVINNFYLFTYKIIYIYIYMMNHPFIIIFVS